MLDCWLMTVCGDIAGTCAMRPSALYNWAIRHSVWWSDLVRADTADLLIAVLNDVTINTAQHMLIKAMNRK